ncbi:MAG TPA: PfkB family carbohydrate kinase [Pyrinomonadaceae bacterium]|jgi:rfaE bifunctional protein kinase chain/domain
MPIEQKGLSERLTAIVERFPRRKVLVVGDLLADQFLFGEISRVSREAPVLILRHERTETMPGGAANCAANLASLGAQTIVVGVVGEDGAGNALTEKLRAYGVDCRGVLSSSEVQTTTKVRILAGQVHSTRQQVIRVDYEGGPFSNRRLREQVLERLREEAKGADALILSDYNYGVADEEAAAIARRVGEERGIPVLVDSRFRLNSFAGFTSATPNEDEVEKLLGRQLEDAAEIEAAGRELRERLGYKSLLITRGNRGMVLFEPDKEPLRVEAVGALEPVDVTGAGDTVIATYALALSCGASFADAAHLANHAGGLVVMKRGTASVKRNELLASVQLWAGPKS